VYGLFKLIHAFGWSIWLAGLLGTAAAQVATRRAGSAEGRSAAWSVVRRLQGLEIAGMILVPSSGLILGTVLAGGFAAMFTNPLLRFVHVKLGLVAVALVLDVATILKRQELPPFLAAGGPEFDRRLKRLAMLHGIATLMLPLAVFTVIAMKYGFH
jgi:uncharacterized membrane protein